MHFNLNPNMYCGSLHESVAGCVQLLVALPCFLSKTNQLYFFLPDSSMWGLPDEALGNIWLVTITCSWRHPKTVPMDEFQKELLHESQNVCCWSPRRTSCRNPVWKSWRNSWMNLKRIRMSGETLRRIPKVTPNVVSGTHLVAPQGGSFISTEPPKKLQEKS